MNRDELLKTINNTIQGLHYKINFISNIHDDGNERIMAVKKKTIDVLSSVVNKISSAGRNDLDLSELERGLDNINIKSLQLYENALNKIYELKQEMHHNSLTNENIIDFSKDIEKASTEIKDMKTEPEDEISKQAISVLKTWLVSEGDDR